jgi:hypothetical protein
MPLALTNRPRRASSSPLPTVIVLRPMILEGDDQRDVSEVQPTRRAALIRVIWNVFFLLFYQ